MKHIMREYLPMELEKDDRVYGGHDAAVRADMPTKADERWLEILKPYVTFTAYAEVGAGRCDGDAHRRGPEQRAAQRLPRAVRRRGAPHGHADGLARWYNKHVPDPEGWNWPEARSRATRSRTPASTSSRSSWSATRSSARSSSRSSPRRRSPTWPSSRCPTSARATATSRCRRPTCRCSPTRRATSRTATRR